MFEKATRQKVRFNFRGQISAEDLWDLKLTDLDSIYKALSKQKRETEGESLLDVKTAENKEIELKMDIVKHIVAIKVGEENARKDLAEKKKYKNKIGEILQEKEDEKLKSMSVDDLKKLMEG